MAEKLSFWQTILHHVRSGHLRATGIEMMVAALMLLIAGMLLLGANVSDLRRINLSVQQAQSAIQLSDKIDGCMANIELAARGYIITGDRFFVERFEARSQEMQKTLPLLIQDMKQSDADNKYADLLLDMIPRRQNQLAAMLALGATRDKTALANVVSRRTWEERQVLVRILAAVRNNRMVQVRQLQQSAAHKVSQVYLLSAIFSGVSFALALLGLFLTGYVHPRQMRALSAGLRR